MISTLFFAASSLLTLALGAPVTPLSRRGAASYQIFGGDGTVNQGWPSTKQWLSYEQLWAINEPTLHISCTQYAGSPQNNKPEEIAAINSTLVKVAGQSGLDARFLLVIMMQESKGCVRAPTTNYGYNNPGLFQSFQGKGTCNPDNVNFQTPCPQPNIELMIQEGAGMGLEFGLTQAIQQTGASDDSKYYKGARTYNSGHIAASGNLGDGIATHCYASDIANRLVGWPDDKVHHSSCSETAIQGYAGANTAYAGAVQENATPVTPVVTPVQADKGAVQPPAQSTALPVQPAQPKKETTQPTTPTVTEPTGTKMAGAAANCKSWYTVKAGDNCSSTTVSFDTLRKLNPSLDANCSNLWLGYAYCIAA